MPWPTKGALSKVKPAADEQEDVDRVAQHGDPQHDRKGAAAQDQVDAAGGHDPDENGYQGLHQRWLLLEMQAADPGQDQQHGADDTQEDSQVEDHGAGQLEGADHRQGHVAVAAGEEGIAE